MEQRLRRTGCATKPAPSKSIQVRELIMNGMTGGTLGRGDTYQLDLFKRGAKIWIKDVERVWTIAELLQDLRFDSSNVLVRRISDNEELEYEIARSGLPFLCNPDILLGKDDLTHLSCLTEPELLNNLRYRFEQLEKVYTYSGICLVAINPYADCSNFYGEDIIQVYQGQGKQVRNLIPHIYGIAEEAFFDLKAWQKNQSVIVSGESGSGKTVSAKYVMKYLTHTSSGLSDDQNGIEQRVLASNPIMESIGNAKTLRNDNSSRFGKFIQINFNERFSINGAEIKTYLLEKSRVVSQSTDERNYHIFYQLSASKSHPLLADLRLDTPDHYNYTNQGALTISDVDDQDEFNRTVQALTQLKISDEQQRAIFKVLAGILFLGNVNFSPSGDYSQVDPASKHYFDKFCDNFSINADEVSQWLCAHEMRAGSEIFIKKLSMDAAVSNRDAMAKLIYATIFNFIVDKINENLSPSSATKKIAKNSNFIGVLDIYGFESYEDCNSFEQFCINYANERLQNSFNNYVFKLEQAEYQKEEISFETIQFYDNSPCIDLISGLISLLDEQSKTGRGTDEDWLLQMETSPKTKGCEHLQLPKIKNSKFIVKHFASDVRYTVDGFLVKNLDSVSEKLLGTIANAKFGFLHNLLSPVLASLSVGNKRKKTVAVKFHESLKELNDVLDSTRPHYVRCIKPNDEKAAFCFDPKRAIEQMRASGVLETVRIAATGFPNRWTYAEFFNRYRVLNPRSADPREFVKTVSSKHLTADMFAFGKTKFFMKIGQIAKLEIIRQKVLYDSATKIQAIWRGHIQRLRYLKLLKMHYAAIKLQTYWRGYVQREKFRKIRSIVLDIQSRFRANIVRREYRRMRYEHSAKVIQRCVRGYMVRREQIHYIRNVTIVQACIRRWLAKREMRKLKAEARSVNHLSNLNKDLANKLIELRQSLDTVNYDLAKKCNDILAVEAKLYEVSSANEELQKQILHANNELENERSKSNDLTTLYSNLQASTSTEISKLVQEKDELASTLKEKSGEITLMQEQLMKNVDLMISPEFQGDASSAASLSRTSSELSCNKVRVILDQQEIINELRHRLDKFGRLNEKLQLDLHSQQLGDSSVFKSQDLMKIQHLELMNQRYKAEIDSFVGKGDDNTFVERFKALQEENERIQEENTGLRSLLTQFFEKKTASVRDSGHWSNSSNSSDDGLTAPSSEIEEYLSNQKLLRQYRVALSIASSTLENRDLQITQLGELRSTQTANDDENSVDTDSKKVAQLANENLILQKKLDRTTEELSVARGYLSGTSSLSDAFNDDQSELLKLDALSPNNHQHAGFLEVFNIPEFAKILIYDLRPRLALKLPSCLPAHLLLAAFRYFDHTQNELLISNLFNAVHVILKEISANSRDDFDIQALWLCNVWSLLNLLRQYSGEAEDEWTAQNTEKQNELRMHSFNFEPIRNQLKIQTENFYTNFMKYTIEPVLTPKISHGILFHESAPFEVAGEMPKNRKLSREPSKEVTAQSLDDIKEFLSIVYTKLNAFGSDAGMLVQIFGQISQWICALAMNQLVYRKDLCTFEKAIQIKHNVTEIKGWLERQKLGDCSDALEPLVQASNLMMSRKVESNLDVLSGEMTSHLTHKQIITILTSYNPPQGFEEDVVSPEFVAKLSKRLDQRNDPKTLHNDSAIMLGTFLKPFNTQRFVYSAEDVQKLTLPSSLKLDSVSRLI